MHGEQAAADRSDPGARAVAGLERAWARDRRARIGTALVLGVLAIAGTVAAEPVTGDSGATVGTIAGALLLVALAAAIWPYRWSEREQRHRELDSKWRALRTDADQAVAWQRYVAWADASGESVELALIRCAPAVERIGGAPSPYGREVVRRLDMDDVAAAAHAMEGLRAKAAERELRARQRFERRKAAQETRVHEARLRDIDQAAAEEIRAGEERARREVAQQEAAERRAQAEAVARALRRP